MAYKFLYIDDNSEINANGIITGLGKDGELEIVFDNPKGNWEQERQRILSEEFKNYDGLILDLNLEEMPNKNKDFSLYKGSTLAQEIRNISKAGLIKEIPIILLSATFNLSKYFDKTNEDLFDLIVSRDDLGDLFIETRFRLISLAKGYNIISENKNNLPNVFKHDLQIEDLRFLGEVKSIFEYPIHTIANFIIKNLLSQNGILITEDILATRLGIDKLKSKDWVNLLDKLDKYAYKGVFAEGWQRWWMSGIENWWSSDLSIEHSLRSTNAKEKVQIIKEKTGLNELVEIEKLIKSKSEAFWTNCVGTNAPIDTIDGLLIANQDNFYPWQDKNYISIEEALKPTAKRNWKKISLSEDFKLEQLKKMYPNERPNASNYGN